ncbi:MAG: response regulator [Chitinophagaceae bacterium]
MKKIFLADDDRDDWFILEDAMNEIEAYEMVEFFINGEHLIKGLEAAYDANDLPCLIILDLNMPRISGTEILGMIKDDIRFNKIPVIIYSTSINYLERKKCMELGAQDYITKPVSSAESVEIARMLSSYTTAQMKATA